MIRLYALVGACYNYYGTNQFEIYRDNAEMTIERCMTTCSKLGHPYAGLVYAAVCNCGSAAPPSDKLHKKSDCSMVTSFCKILNFLSYKDNVFRNAQGTSLKFVEDPTGKYEKCSES